MNTFVRMNQVIAYIEGHLTDELNLQEVARLALCPLNQFQRFFSFITNYSLSEYVRRRRLTMSAFDLQDGAETVTNVALKYGYESPSSFSRAFRAYHGMTPTEATRKDAVFRIFPKLCFQVPALDLDHAYQRGENKMAILGKMEFFQLPPVRMIGKEVSHGDGSNPVPALWEKCFEEKTLDVLVAQSPEIDYYIGWMGDANPETGQFSYIAGYFMPAGTPVPDGFQFRDIAACTIGMSYINGNLDDVFPRIHEMTVEGIQANGYEPDYSQGWSAEVYPKDLSFEAEEGTVHYFCPCRIKE